MVELLTVTFVSGLVIGGFAMDLIHRYRITRN